MKYKWNAEDYEKHSFSQKKWAKELINKLKLNGNESILDIGCGDGKISAEIAQNLPNGKVVAIDNSENMINLACKNYPHTKYPNLNFKIMDASDLNFFEEFDIVFSNAALHWIKDHNPVLQGIYNALKHRGKAVVQMGGKGNALEVINVINEITKFNPWKKFFEDFTFPYSFFSVDEYSSMLKLNNFKIIYIKIIPKIMVHENIEYFKGWIRTTWLPYLNQIPEHLQDKFINLIAKNYSKNHLPDEKGRILVKMKRLEFIAVK